MKRFRILLVTGVSQILTGCSGHIYVMNSDQAAQKFGSENEKTRYVGVPFSPLRERIYTYYQDRILDKDGKVIKIFTGTDADTAATACDPVKIQEAQIAADVDPRNIKYISYEPGIFETSNFGVELENGAISKVTSSSTPGVKVVADAASTIVSAARLGFTGQGIAPLAPCTAGKLIRPD
ncbi:hypothetical protein MJP36_20225 [Pseudomonas palleroniana]|uniref:hypothetical protein n=1 Tax=Pseudomonas palleroniana TaxID=191390 RepID=UPI001FCC1854|nr:hypothetical protein [Pseudomonas palleroniana]UOK36824.1 hypothetical protein MJP36_20225 [Pseudomonas palleroniana]